VKKFRRQVARNLPQNLETEAIRKQSPGPAKDRFAELGPNVAGALKKFQPTMLIFHVVSFSLPDPTQGLYQIGSARRVNSDRIDTLAFR
jgi:hypothetical protein